MICQVCEGADFLISELIGIPVESRPKLATYAIHTYPGVCSYVCNDDVEFIINTLDESGLRYWLRSLTSS